MIAAVAFALVAAVAMFVVAPLFGQEFDTTVEPAAGGGELWVHEKAIAVLAISEADFDRATGKLSDDDYRVLRTDYEGRALQAMDEMERTAPAAEEPAIRFCAACGSQFSSADAFCGCCGSRRFAA